MTNVANWLSALVNHYFKNGPQNGQEVVLYITHSELIEAWRNNYPESAILDEGIIKSFYLAIKESSSNQDFFVEPMRMNIPKELVPTYAGFFHIPISLLWISAVILAVTESEDDQLQAGNYYLRISKHLIKHQVSVSFLTSKTFGDFYVNWIKPTEKRFSENILKDKFGKLYIPTVNGKAYTDWIKAHTILKVAQVNKLPSLFKSLKLGSKSNPSLSKWKSLFIENKELFISELGLGQKQLNTIALNNELSEQFIRFLNSRLVQYKPYDSTSKIFQPIPAKIGKSPIPTRHQIDLEYQLYYDKSNQAFYLMACAISNKPIEVDEDVFSEPILTEIGHLKYPPLLLDEWIVIAEKNNLSINHNWLNSQNGLRVKCFAMPSNSNDRMLFSIEAKTKLDSNWTALLLSSHDDIQAQNEFGLAYKSIRINNFSLLIYVKGLIPGIIPALEDRILNNQIEIKSPFALGNNKFLSSDPFLIIDFGDIDFDSSQDVMLNWNDASTKLVFGPHSIVDIDNYPESSGKLNLSILNLKDGTYTVSYYNQTGHLQTYRFTILSPTLPQGVPYCFNKFGESFQSELVQNITGYFGSNFLPMEFDPTLKNNVIINGFPYGLIQNHNGLVRNGSYNELVLNCFLDFLSHLGKIGFERAKLVISLICSGRVKPSKLLQELSALGYLYIDYKNNFVIAIRPYVLMTPSKLGPTFTVFGTITTSILNRLNHHHWADFYEAYPNLLTSVKLKPNAQANLTTYEKIAEILDQSEIVYLRYKDMYKSIYSTSSILSTLSSVKDYFAHLISNPVVGLNNGIVGYKTFNPSIGWVLVPETVNLKTFEGVIEYSDGYRQKYYWWKEGIMYETEKQWAIWVTIWKMGWTFDLKKERLIHQLADKNLELSFFINKDEGKLYHSPNLKLPPIFEQAIIKRSGSLPLDENNLKVYEIGTSSTDLVNQLKYFLS